MHVVVSKKELLRVLGRCQGVADKKSTMPVLGNVLLETRGADQLRLAATDLLLAVRGTIPASVEREGAIALGARDLLDRIRMMPEGQVSITANDGSSTTIRALGTARRYTLHGIPGEEFPNLPQPEEGHRSLTLPVRAVADLVQATHFSISTDETRTHLNSALFECDGHRVRMVTTDGHRLSKLEQKIDRTDVQASMLIPLKGVLELKRLCEEARAEVSKSDDADHLEVSMVQSGPNVFFHLGGFQFSVKLVDAQFPPYQQVIPDASERVVRASRLAMADALRAVSVAASDRTGGVKLTLNTGKIRFESESPESGEGFDEIPVDYDGPEITVGFNAKYFLEVLLAVEDEEILLGLSGELDPAIIRPGNEAPRSSYLAVVMPMRI
ncbi:MAG: DNA polymerase III subunit beta [Polyangiaceae bacterium]|nr:DNA polymerase III subunit beta [Polyangiaceae bacterium]